MEIDDYLLDELGGRAKGSEIYLCCPFCSDRGHTLDDKFNLQYNIYKEVAHCWRCEYSAHKPKLLQDLKRLKLIDDIAKFRAIRPAKPVSPTPTCVGTSRDPVAGYPRVAGDDSDPAKYVRQLLLVRGLSEEDIDYYDIRYCVDIKDKNFLRYIIPCNLNGVNKFYSARAFNKDAKKRYLNPDELECPEGREHLIFNLDHFQEPGLIMGIFEGQINAMVTGRFCVATFGKNLTDSQFYLMLNKQCKEYIVAFDKDALAFSIVLAYRFYLHGARASIVFFSDDRDPADLGRKTMTSLLKARKRFTVDMLNQVPAHILSKHRYNRKASHVKEGYHARGVQIASTYRTK